jgi:hypothetical protein
VKELNRIKDPKEYTEKLEAIKYTRECIRQKVTTNAEVNHLKYLNKRTNEVPVSQQGTVSLISKDKLMEIFKDFLKDKFNENENHGGDWRNGSHAGLFSFYLYDVSSREISNIGSCLYYKDDELIGYDIWNTWSSHRKYVNIKIRGNNIEFIEDSKFEDFSKEEMRKLYEMIKNVICEGDFSNE